MYSVAWLDSRTAPGDPRAEGEGSLLRDPADGPSTEDFENLGSVHRTPPGDYAVVGPDNDVKLPKHLPRIESYAKGEDLKDLKQVHKIQDGITVSR
jgi:hypothetical protein